MKHTEFVCVHAEDIQAVTNTCNQLIAVASLLFHTDKAHYSEIDIQSIAKCFSGNAEFIMTVLNRTARYYGKTSRAVKIKG